MDDNSPSSWKIRSSMELERQVAVDLEAQLIMGRAIYFKSRWGFDHGTLFYCLWRRRSVGPVPFSLPRQSEKRTSSCAPFRDRRNDVARRQTGSELDDMLTCAFLSQEEELWQVGRFESVLWNMFLAKGNVRKPHLTDHGRERLTSLTGFLPHFFEFFGPIRRWWYRSQAQSLRYQTSSF